MLARMFKQRLKTQKQIKPKKEIWGHAGLVQTRHEILLTRMVSFENNNQLFPFSSDLFQYQLLQ